MDKTICVDARMVENSGIGTYIQELVLRIKNHYRLTLLVNRDFASKDSRFKDLPFIFTEAPIYSIQEQLSLPYLIPACDLFWSPHFNIPILRIRAKRRLVTIHDVFFLKFAKELGIHKRLYSQFFMSAAVKRSDQVITVSQFSALEMGKYLGDCQHKLNVIPLGVDREKFGKDTLNLQKPFPSKYILYVGNLALHKNIDSLLKALDLLPKELHLVLVGKETKWKGWQAEFEKRKSRITIFGRVDDETLTALYQNAELLIHPSYYEGFGLTPLEAMSAGCPVVVSKAASLPEVCGDAVVYIDPLDVKSIADGILSVWDQPECQRNLRRKGKERVELFHWDATAKKHIEVIDKILKERSS